MRQVPSAKPLILVAVIALAAAFVAFWMVAHPAHLTEPREVGGRWYADDAPDTLQPNGTDPGVLVDLADSDKFWKDRYEYVGRRVSYVGASTS
jgi:hypothetical protein